MTYCFAIKNIRSLPRLFVQLWLQSSSIFALAISSPMSWKRNSSIFVLMSVLLGLGLCPTSVSASWEEWWTYDGISGPDFWGRLNPKWGLCSRGRRQSPIDVKPELLLFDPILPPLQIIGHHVNGNLINTGRGIIFKVSSASNKSHFPEDTDPPPMVHVSLGPLSYRYTLSHLTLHYGREISRGSEHTINGFQFPGEIQFYAFNSQLYSSWDEAAVRAHGIAAISLLIQISPDPRQANNQLKRITHALKNITSKGNSQRISSLSVSELLSPGTRRQYMTYEGSLTQPACHETVQWIILNKPVYMTSHLFHSLRQSMQSEGSHGADNYRPIQRINGRSVRTNIDFFKGLGDSGEQEHNEIEYENLETFDGLSHVQKKSGSGSAIGSNGSSSSRKETCSMKRPVVYRGRQ